MVKVVGEAGEREVIQNDSPTLYDKDVLKLNAVKPLNHRTFPEQPLGVVIAENEVDVTVQSPGFQKPIPLLNIAETEVSEVVHMVIRLHNGVPVSHECVIHFLKRPKRSVTIFEYVLVESVRIRAEPNLPHILRPYLCNKIVLIHIFYTIYKGKNLDVMAYLKWNALVITDCSKYATKEVKELIQSFREKHPTNKGLAKRTDKCYINEWAVHALCYRWGIAKEKTKDADLQFDIEPEVSLMYNVLGPIARLILSFYR